MNKSMRRMIFGSLIGLCLQSPAVLADSKVGNESWKGYMPDEAMSDMLSSPLKLVGKGREKGMFGVESCVYRNSMVTVVRQYCHLDADAERGDAEELTIIPHDHRGTVHLYAEPSSGKVLNVKNSMWYVDVKDSGALPADKNISKMTAKEIISYAHEQKFGDEIVRGCHAGSPTVIVYDSQGKALPAKTGAECFVGRDFKKFKTEWMGELDHFYDEGNQQNWIKMLRAVGVKKALPQAKTGNVRVQGVTQIDPTVAQMVLKGIETTSESPEMKEMLDKAKRTDGYEKSNKGLESVQEPAKETSSESGKVSKAD